MVGYKFPLIPKRLGCRCQFGIRSSDSFNISSQFRYREFCNIKFFRQSEQCEHDDLFSITVIRLKHFENQLVMRIKGIILRCAFGNEFSQRQLLKNIHAQNL